MKPTFSVRTKVIAIGTILLAANVSVWALALLILGPSHPLLLGTALLAYTFGLRHAVDADHISAIDNVTRKLVQENKRPVSVGFFFSLGHSTVVILMCAAIAAGSSQVRQFMPALHSAGSLIGTSISAAFLFAIAAVNAVVLAGIFDAFRKVRRGEPYSDADLNAMLEQRGLAGRFFRPLLASTSKSWQMYPVGFLFGLGFDTATEIALLGIAAIEAGKGLPLWTIMLFPALFTAGMSLVDTADGILMLGAYGWAFVKPVRKLYYNLNITLVSVLVAVVVGALETLSVLSSRFNLQGPFWQGVATLAGNFGVLGFTILGIFVTSWVVSTAIYKLKGYDEIEVSVVR